MHNPLNHIDEAKKVIQQRQKQRESYELEHRGALAAENVADELTMMRAEMTVIRELLASIAAKPAR